MTIKRRVFYSFHYKNDNWRASHVRNIGLIEGNQPASDNDWETVKKGGDEAIKRWINSQMQNRTCTVVLVGSGTANRKWINYEIVQSWHNRMGVAGIYIHGLKDSQSNTSFQGKNPFDYISFDNGQKLSSVAKCYSPGGNNRQVYDWIRTYLADVIEEAINIRNRY